MTETIAVAIPCYNEAVTIANVVADFAKVIPEAEIHVFDNRSTDDSINLAKKAGATVHHVRQQGKGHVMRTIFDTLKVDALVIVDGDDTYFAEDVHDLIKELNDSQADMIVGNRLPSASDDSMVRLHQFGNALIGNTINRMFGTSYQDILSGYRVFSRNFVETVPVLTSGFEVETEMTLQALEEGLHVVEVPIRYRSRPEGSESKLRSFQDGWRIMVTAAMLLRDHQPLRLFGLLSAAFGFAAFIAGILRILNYFTVTTISNSLLVGIILLFAPLAILSLGVGLTLSAVNTRFKEMKQIMRRNKNLDGR